MACSSPATSCRISSCSDSAERGPSRPKVIWPPSGYTAPRPRRVCPSPAIIGALARVRRCDAGGMRKARLGLAMVLCLAWAGTLFLAHAAAAQTTPRPTVLSLKLNGVVDPFMASYVKRGIGQANADNDAAVLITIDTPGGLDSSMREI